MDNMSDIPSSLSDKLKALRANPSSYSGWSLGEVSEIARVAIMQRPDTSDELKQHLLYTWETGGSRLPPDLEAEVLSHHKFLVRRERKHSSSMMSESAAKCTTGSLRMQLGIRESPYIDLVPDSEDDWIPGQPIKIQNWPPLSKDPENPDAGLWDPKNPSHCAATLEAEGWRVEGMRIIDWTPARHDNEETGKNPQGHMSEQFLRAASDVAFFEINISLVLGATVTVVSSWCGDEFFDKYEEEGISILPVDVEVPYSDMLAIPSTIWFAESHFCPGKLGKMFFRDSLASLTKPTSVVDLAMNQDATVRLAQASEPLIFDRLIVKMPDCLFSASHLGDDVKWFFCQIKKYAKKERDAGIAFSTFEQLRDAGCKAALPHRLAIYHNNNRDDIDEIRQSLPFQFHSSLVACVDALMDKRRAATLANRTEEEVMQKNQAISAGLIATFAKRTEAEKLEHGKAISAGLFRRAAAKKMETKQAILAGHAGRREAEREAETLPDAWLCAEEERATRMNEALQRHAQINVAMNREAKKRRKEAKDLTRVGGRTARWMSRGQLGEAKRLAFVREREPGGDAIDILSNTSKWQSSEKLVVLSQAHKSARQPEKGSFVASLRDLEVMEILGSGEGLPVGFFTSEGDAKTSVHMR